MKTIQRLLVRMVFRSKFRLLFAKQSYGKIILLAITATAFACSSNEEVNPTKGEVMGSVKDQSGNPYPKTSIKLTKGSENLETETNSEGNFDFNTKGIGIYELTMILPLSTTAITNQPVMVDVQSDQISMIDLVIEPQPLVANLNFGNVDIFDEIKDKDGNIPSDPNEPLYAANIFDPPLGLLNAIKAPDGHHITLSEWLTAKGNLMVDCNGNNSTVTIALEGLIPNGTYTFWLAFLNKPKKIGQNINGATDFVNHPNPPLGSGTKNIVIAGADGTINTTIEHTSCILTQEVALVIPVIYHLNGKTFGSGHIPDTEEVAHMLVYFQ